MVDAARHPNIDIRTYTEVERVEGYVGNFNVQLREKSKYVIADRCNGCGECAKACPIEVPNYFEMNLAPRKAAYIPMSQSVPLIYNIDMDACIHCYKCVDACGQLNAIDFSMEDKISWEEIGSIVVATGFSHFDPSVMPEYGYGKYPNVITSMEMERLNNSAGATHRKHHPTERWEKSQKNLPSSTALDHEINALIRDVQTSAVCTQLKMLCCSIQMNPDTEISVYYMDIRTPSKGYEEFYDRARQMGVKFIQGRPGLITEDPDNT